MNTQRACTIRISLSRKIPDCFHVCKELCENKSSKFPILFIIQVLTSISHLKQDKRNGVFAQNTFKKVSQPFPLNLLPFDCNTYRC